MTTVTRQEFTELTKRVDQHGRSLAQHDDEFRLLTENIEGLSKKVTEGFEKLDKRMEGLEGRMDRIDERMDELPARIAKALQEPVSGQPVIAGRKESRFPSD